MSRYLGSEMIQNTMVARAARLIAAKQEHKKKINK